MQINDIKSGFQTQHRCNSPPLTPSSNDLTGSLGLFASVWRQLVELQNSDPFPSVARLARRCVAHFQRNSDRFDAARREIIVSTSTSSSSSSQLSYNNINVNSDNNGGAYSDNDEDEETTKKKRDAKNSRNSDYSSSKIVDTDFVNWCSDYFLKPLLVTQQQQQQPSLQSETLTTATATASSMTLPRLDIFATDFLDQRCKTMCSGGAKKKQLGVDHQHQWLLNSSAEALRRQRRHWLDSPQSMAEQLRIKHTAWPLHCKFLPFDEQLLFVADLAGRVNYYIYTFI